MMKPAVWICCCVLLAGCGSMGGVFGDKSKPAKTERAVKPGADKPVAEKPAETPKRGGYYLDDGPGDNPPPDIDAIPDPVPRYEPLLPRSNRPYMALGESYTPMTEYQPYRASGIASWYGKRYHGQKTSSGELYDMYGMSAAHPTLPIPSYVRVTNPENGRSVVVRVNDRGPFKKDRLIDLSYAAAYKLRLTDKGSGQVEVEAIDARKAETAPTQPVSGVEKSAEQSIDKKQLASGGAFVQVGAFKQKDNADQLRDRIRQSGVAQSGEVESWYNDGIHRVRLGPYANRDEAERTAAQIKQTLGLTAIVTTQ
jgi:rare lipoprotein A